MADTQALQFHCTTCPSECLLDVVIEKDGDVTRVLKCAGAKLEDVLYLTLDENGKATLVLREDRKGAVKKP